MMAVLAASVRPIEIRSDDAEVDGIAIPETAWKEEPEVPHEKELDDPTRAKIEQALKPWKNRVELEKRYSSEQIMDCVEAFLRVRCRYDSACTRFLKLLDENWREAKQLKKVKVYDKQRTKDPVSLAKKLQDQSRKHHNTITVRELFSNEGITDLGGVCLVYLYREQWKIAREFIGKVLESHEGLKLVEYTAYVRDAEKYGGEDELKDFVHDGVTPSVALKESGYSSFHYLLRWDWETEDTKIEDFKDTALPRSHSRHFDGQILFNGPIIEVQARSFIEAGWHEIDHRRRYKGESSPLVRSQLRILNEVAGLFDDVAGSFDSIDRTPRTVSWDELMALALEAKTVTILSNRLVLGHGERKDIAEFVRDSAAKLEVFVTCEKKEVEAERVRKGEAKGIHDLWVEIKRTITEEQHDRVKFWTASAGLLDTQSADHVLLQCKNKKKNARFIRVGAVEKAEWDEITHQELVGALEQTVESMKKKAVEGWRPR